MHSSTELVKASLSEFSAAFPFLLKPDTAVVPILPVKKSPSLRVVASTPSMGEHPGPVPKLSKSQPLGTVVQDLKGADAV